MHFSSVGPVRHSACLASPRRRSSVRHSACASSSLFSCTNLVTTVIGFWMSATFIVFMRTRINYRRIRGSVKFRMMYEIESRIDIEQLEHHTNDSEPEPIMFDTIPILKFNQEAFSAILMQSPIMLDAIPMFGGVLYRSFVPRKDFLKRGDLQSARLYVHVKPALDRTFTDIEMWIFCPFNGPATLKIGMKNIPSEN
ncbi:RING-H2 finger proteinO [Arachis hypogaea]|nr:RING-H2 finger proteinO [Arachis hypogaea]